MPDSTETPAVTTRTNRNWIYRTMLVIGIAPAALRSQQMIIGTTGRVFRYNGDTIWMELDSTITRSIRRGDTIFERRMVNDRLDREWTILAPPDPGEVSIETRADGREYPRSNALTATLSRVGATRASFALAVKSWEIDARSLFPSRHEPPLSPQSVREYVLTPASRLVQHRDTVRLIKGCPAERNDTTTFLLFGNDSVRRISAPQRTFGIGMAQGLLGQMRHVLLEAEVRAYDSTLLTRVPVSIDPCRRS